MAEVFTVNGGKWGDEGKGKVVDFLAQDATVVIRANGGDNAGHTVVNNFGTFPLHLIPSGIFNPDAICMIGADTAVNLSVLIQEMKLLEESGVSTKNLRLSKKAHLVFDYHIEADRLNEMAKAKDKQAVGTTQRGIGPAYEDKAARIGIRAGELLNPVGFKEHLKRNLKEKAQRYGLRTEFLESNYDGFIEEAINVVAPLVVDTEEITHQRLGRRSERFLLEGAQGTILSITHGRYPKVTSCDTTANGLLMAAGIPARYLTRSFGIYKAYDTCVGAGGFPTELLDESGKPTPQHIYIRTTGGEIGTTTGRDRRVGFFDGVAARYSYQINGFSDIVVTRLDTLAGVGELKICDSYQLGDQIVTRFPADDELLSQCQALYGSKRYTWGGMADIRETHRFDDLDYMIQDYCGDIMTFFPEARLYGVGTGPARKDLITLP